MKTRAQALSEDLNGKQAVEPPWHALDVEEVLDQVDSAPGVGLSAQEVRRRAELHGLNVLPSVKRKSVAGIFFKQFRSPLIYLLMLAAGTAFFLGHQTDAVVILTIVLINAVIGSVQEGRAEKSMEALQQLTAIQTRVLRSGTEELIDARNLVRGDVLLLEGGDAVGADARLLEVSSLEVSEAALTGESLPIPKNVSAVALDAILAERRSMIHAGTYVTSGRGRAVVVATGLETEVGKIAALTASAEVPKTPLEQKVARFGHTVVQAALVLFALVMAIGLLRGLPFSEILMVSISQVVSVIPEGLPVAMTVALAVGMQRMARRGAIVRRLAGVETLGSTNVICTDKTGTLTRNEMTVTAILHPDGRTIEVSGSGYEPIGKFVDGETELDPLEDKALVELLQAGVLCNDAKLISPNNEVRHWSVLGDPTEGSLLTLADKGRVPIDDTRKGFPRLAEIPFDSQSKMMAVKVQSGDGTKVFLKGAPEAILDLSGKILAEEKETTLDEQTKARIHITFEAMAGRALRILAFAVVDGTGVDLERGFESLRLQPRFLGLVGQFDPPRPEVRAAVQQCQDAGIRPILVTGDHKATGLAVARMLGIAREEDIAIEGKEFAELSQQELQERLDRISVFARVHPAQKLRIVEAFQAKGAVVAMTGDGVNDAPALAKADVGVAMGIAGTEVAKAASNIVITDDNFTTIVHAVEEGRLVYGNLKKLILYLIGTGISEIVVLFLALALGYPLPLAAVQILWVNLVADGTMTLPLVMDPAQGDEMRRPPIPRGEPILTYETVKRMALMVFAMACSVFGYFAFRIHLGIPFEQVQTETFTVLAVSQWFNALNCRSKHRSAFVGLFTNWWIVGGLVLGNLLHVAVIYAPPLNLILHTVPLPLGEAILIGLTGSVVLWVEELRKVIARRSRRVESK